MVDSAVLRRMGWLRGGEEEVGTLWPALLFTPAEEG